MNMFTIGLGLLDTRRR